MATRRSITGERVAVPAEEIAAEQARHDAGVAAAARVAHRRNRAIAYRDQLGKEAGDYIRTLGDVLDILIEQVEANRVAAGAQRTEAFAGMLGKIAAIKAANPKPD